jgi:pimeloyl-ACP methyl ester carboxylesterase
VAQISGSEQTSNIVDSALTADWSGSVVTSMGMRYQLLIHVVAYTNASCEVTYDIVDQQKYGLRFTTESCEPDRILWQNDSTGASFEGALLSNLREIQGVWRQGRTTVPLRLRKVSNVVHLQEPSPTNGGEGYVSRDFIVPNAEAGLQLVGTLVLPSLEGAHPAFLFVSDQGMQDRNETDVTGHKPFLVLSHALAMRGVASVRMDDRGIGSSTGTPHASIDERVEDVTHALQLMAREDGIDPTRIFIFGHGSGGLVGLEAARRAAGFGINIRGVVLAATPSIGGKELLVAQARASDELYGIDPEVTNAAVALMERWYEVAAAAPSTEASVTAILASTDSALLASNDLLGVYPAVARLQQPDREQVVERDMLPWLADYRNLRAPERLTTFPAPTLVLLAERDVAVPIGAVEGAWDRLTNTHANVEVINIPGVNHSFQSCQECTVDEGLQQSEIVTVDVILTVVDWAAQQ